MYTVRYSTWNLRSERSLTQVDFLGALGNGCRDLVGFWGTYMIPLSRSRFA